MRVSGSVLMATLPGARIGERVVIGGNCTADVVGFAGEHAVLLPSGKIRNLRSGSTVVASGRNSTVAFGKALLGRVIDAQGRPLDGRPLSGNLHQVEIERPAPHPLERKPITEILETGVRAVDAFTTVGKGQRLGLFAQPGVGKSTLLGHICRGAKADVVVCALVGERGRELREFIERDIGPEGLERAVVVCATSDRPASERARAVPVATAIACEFRRRGRSVLLLVDSLTRHARACREIALAAGEPPGRRGFPASVFDGLAALLERAGNDSAGTMSAIYTVLTDGRPEDDPLAEEARSLLDGHIVLSRQLAERGVFPAIDIGRSLSRLMNSIVTDRHLHASSLARRVWSAYQVNRDALECGLFQQGANPQLDAMLERYPGLLDWMTQRPDAIEPLENTLESLRQLVEGI